MSEIAVQLIGCGIMCFAAGLGIGAIGIGIINSKVCKQ